jgi:hypothetical protein
MIGEVRKLGMHSKERWYIHRTISGNERERIIYPRYQYMWKDGTWHDSCGGINMWNSREEAEEHLLKYEGVKNFYLDQELFEL